MGAAGAYQCLPLPLLSRPLRTSEDATLAPPSPQRLGGLVVLAIAYGASQVALGKAGTGARQKAIARTSQDRAVTTKTVAVVRRTYQASSKLSPSASKLDGFQKNERSRLATNGATG